MSSMCSCAVAGSLAIARFTPRDPCGIANVAGRNMAFLKRKIVASSAMKRGMQNPSGLRVMCSLDSSKGLENQSEAPRNLMDIIQDNTNVLSSSSAFLLLQSSILCAPALASGYTDEEYIQGILTLVAFVGFYLFVAPPTIFWYLKERTFKSQMLETIFQFCLVFLFFPGLLVWAPFINFRPRPSDPSKMPKF